MLSLLFKSYTTSLRYRSIKMSTLGINKGLVVWCWRRGRGLRSAVCCGQAHLHDASCTWLIVVGRFLPYYTDCPRGSLPNFSTRERLGMSMCLDKSLLVCHKMLRVHPICDLWVFGEYSNEGFVDIYIFFWAKKVRTYIKGLEKAVRGIVNGQQT